MKFSGKRTHHTQNKGALTSCQKNQCTLCYHQIRHDTPSATAAPPLNTAGCRKTLPHLTNCATSNQKPPFWIHMRSLPRHLWTRKDASHLTAKQLTKVRPRVNHPHTSLNQDLHRRRKNVRNPFNSYILIAYQHK
jgi:hypothetical protein